MSAPLRLSAYCLSLALPLCAADAVDGIVQAFATHSVVAIGEQHWMQDAGDFYVRLVRDPRIARTIDDIVIEFASRQSQPVLDRYIAGRDVPIEQLRRVWRDTTKVASWESPIYPRWLAIIREVNTGLPATHKLRVLAGDTKIDWSPISTHEQWMALGDNNLSFTRVIEREVLAKKRWALVLLDSNHLTKSGTRDGGPNVTTRVAQRFLRALFVAVLTTSGDCGIPCLTAGNKDADAMPFLGPKLTRVGPPPGSLEREYARELDRRVRIEWEDRGPKILGSLLGGI